MSACVRPGRKPRRLVFSRCGSLRIHLLTLFENIKSEFCQKLKIFISVRDRLTENGWKGSCPPASAPGNPGGKKGGSLPPPKGGLFPGKAGLFPSRPGLFPLSCGRVGPGGGLLLPSGGSVSSEKYKKFYLNGK